MTATPHSGPDPLDALPLLREAGVSIHWRPLEGRTAWVADADTREVWLSRSIPPESLLRCLIEALVFVDEASEAAPALRLVHAEAGAEDDGSSRPAPPALRVVE